MRALLESIFQQTADLRQTRSKTPSDNLKKNAIKE